MVGGINNGDGNSFAKTICSICYEDLKPVVEDLQAISVCGHVFHELCLQQWFEYCPNVKKRSCPMCKQKCTNANVGRLYFQSVGDPNDSNISQKPRDYEENPQELRKEVDRLEGKAVALASTLEQQQKEFKEVKDELFSCKEQLKAEVMLKNEALTQMATAKQLLRMKSEELDRSTLEHMRVKERNMALAKEIAALKLASDLDLEEHEVMKLASLGNDVGSKETVDILRKSLVIRNKSYKELMAKCNILGRGEARCLHKLEKANEKINKLKLRVQELETAVEVKENGALRVLKDQDIRFKNDVLINTMKRPDNQIDLDETRESPDITFCSRKVEPGNPTSRKYTMTGSLPTSTCHSLVHEKENIEPSSVVGFPCENTTPRANNNYISKECYVAKPDALFDTQNKDEMLKSRKEDKKSEKGDQASKLLTNMDDDVICFGDLNPVQKSVLDRKENKSSIPVSQPGHPYSVGLIGPDGTNWPLGKWCKKSHNQGSTTSSAGLPRSNAISGDLIAVGADGRGGRIKVIRSLDQSSLDTKDTSSLAKKSKLGPKPNKLQPQGHLQIEHFFRRTCQ